MTNFRKILPVFLILFLFVSCSSGNYKSTLLDISKSKRDQERHLRKITLPNKLEVLLISDSKAERSSAAMDVGVGSLSNPKEHQGLAHFIEHMLFMGSKKYPSVDEYHKYIEANGGHTNAYTDAEDTNFHFIVKHDAFEGALDRFAQFFIAPLFDADYVDRERQAVNSEHQKNIQNDGWREERVLMLLSQKEHPASRFTTGNLKTLQSSTRDVLIDFYQKYYSANLMKLVLKSNHSLDDMEAWAKEIFSTIQNKNLARPKFEEKVIDFEKGTPFAQIKPVSHRKVLKLVFELPTFYNYLESKPHYLLASLVGHEGKGSLLSLLKKENLVTELGTGVLTKGYMSQLRVVINLTDKGMAQTDQILSCFFSYIQMLKKEGLKPWFFDEKKKMGEVNYMFRSPQKGLREVESISNWMHHVDPLKIDKITDLFYKYSQEGFSDILSYINPQHMALMLIAPNAKTSSQEEHYGVQYGVSYFSNKKTEQWNKTSLHKDLFYPQQNIFIPSNLDKLGDDEHHTAYKVVDDQRGVFWFMQDKALGIPKAEVSLKILTDKVNESPRARLLSLMYREALYLSHIEWAYYLNAAGMAYHIDRDDRGILVSFSGYSDKIPFVMTEYIKRLKVISINEAQFDDLKKNYQRVLDSWPYNQAYEQASYHLLNLHHKHAIHRDDYPSLDTITLADVKEFAQEIYKEIGIEAVAYGNLQAKDMEKLVDTLYAELGAKVLPKERRLQRDVVKLGLGSNVYLLPKTKTDNNCWMASFIFGPRDAKLKAYLLLGDAYFQTDFFTEMRSKRQLGYVVYTGPDYFRNVFGLRFLIQSGDYDPVYLAEQVMPWLEERVAKMDALSDEEFDTYKTSAIKRLEEKLETVDEWHRFITTGALYEGGNFDYRKDVIAVLKKSTKQELKKVYEKALDKGTRALSVVYLRADGKKAVQPKEGELIKNIGLYKKDKEVF